MAPLPLEELAETAGAIVQAAGGTLHETIVEYHEVTLVLDRGKIVDVLRALRSDSTLQMNVLVDVNAVDYLEAGREPRFDVVYHLYSYETFNRLRLRCPVGEEPDNHIDSIFGLWSGSSFMERETFDMFGIIFDGHPELTRILMDDNWEGHPLRKDYPLGGSTSFYFKQDSDEYAGEPDDLVPRIRVQDSDI